jgi:hypothetical protein
MYLILLFRYAGRLTPRAGGHSSEEYNLKMRNLANLIPYENAPSALFEDIHDRFVYLFISK